MAVILRKAWEGYMFMFDEIPDQRTKTWFLVAKPYQELMILGLYLTFVLKWGPKYMKGRPAYNLSKILIVYNFLQVITCVYIFYMSLVGAWAWDYKWICEPVDTSTSEKALNVAKITYFYHLTKLVDLIDTVFFVLRKKHSQITFLHIYHHTGMVLLTWGAITYLPGGHGTLIGVINSFVHIIMYSYYLYTVVDPSAKQSTWWKKYITQLQILQFLWCVIHMAIIVFKPDCAYPRWTSAVFLPQNFFILVMFIDFYIKTYIRQSPAKADLQKKTSAKQSNRTVSGNDIGHTCRRDELKIAEQALSALKNHETQQEIIEEAQETQDSLKTHTVISSQNRNHQSQSSRRSQKVFHSLEKGSTANSIDYYSKDGKHVKSE